MNKKLISAVAAVALLALTGCTTDADRARQNGSVASEQFELTRDIVGINTRSGEILFQYTGRCSLESGSGESNMPGYLQIACKHGPDDIRIHFQKETTETAITVTQLDGADLSEYNTRILIKPQNLIPNPTVEYGE